MRLIDCLMEPWAWYSPCTLWCPSTCLQQTSCSPSGNISTSPWANPAISLSRRQSYCAPRSDARRARIPTPLDNCGAAAARDCDTRHATRPEPSRLQWVWQERSGDDDDQRNFLETWLPFGNLPSAFLRRDHYDRHPTNRWDNRTRENSSPSSCVHGSFLPTLCTSSSDLPQSVRAEEQAGCGRRRVTELQRAVCEFPPSPQLSNVTGQDDDHWTSAQCLLSRWATYFSFLTAGTSPTAEIVSLIESVNLAVQMFEEYLAWTRMHDARLQEIFMPISGEWQQ